MMVLTFGLAMAQGNGQPRRDMQHGSRPSIEDFMAEKTRFMLKEMHLSAADSAKFVPLFTELQKEKADLIRKYGSGMREVSMKLRRNEAVADSMYVKIVMNEAEMQVADAMVEKKYLEMFQTILTPQQLFNYQNAARKFKSNMMNRPQQRRPQGANR